MLMSEKSVSHFPKEPQIKINNVKKQKHGYLIHTWSDKAFEGSVVNRALSSFLGGSLEYTFTVDPLVISTAGKQYRNY